MRAKLIKVIDQADNIKTYLFEPEGSYLYTAGQFAEWTLPHKQPDNRGDNRWFTISSSPKDKYISLTTKFSSTNPSSYKTALHKMTPGDVIQVSQPMGDFVLPKIIQTPLVFVAGGIGITPFHSILSWLSQTKEKRPLKMLYGVNSEDEIIFEDTFKKANQHVAISVQKPSSSWGGERGALTAEMIVGLEKPSQDTLIYISGPETMVEQLEKDLLRIGVAKKQLVLDFFPNYLGY